MRIMIEATDFLYGGRTPYMRKGTMRFVTIYVSNDGSRWDTYEESEKRDAVLATIEKAMAPLGPTPKLGEWQSFQHKVEDYQAAKAAILALAKEEFGTKNTDPEVFDPEKVDPRHGFVGRLISDSDKTPLKGPWHRLRCFSPDGREWGLPFYARFA